MKFSIIIATFNPEASSLRRTLDSLKNQTYDTKQFEIVIVDGGSTNGTTELVELYKQQLSCHVHYSSEPDKGIYDAFNKGIKRASGDYIHFKGAGDWLEPRALTEIALAAESYDYDLLYCYMQLWQITNNGHLKKSYPSPSCEIKEPVLYSNPYHQHLFYKRALHERYGLYNDHFRIASDWEFFLNISYNPAMKRTIVPLVLAHFVQDGISSLNYVDGYIEVMTLSLNVLETHWTALALFQKKNRIINFFTLVIGFLFHRNFMANLLKDQKIQSIFWSKLISFSKLWNSSIVEEISLFNEVQARLNWSKEMEQERRPLVTALFVALKENNADSFWQAVDKNISSHPWSLFKNFLKKLIRMILPYGVIRSIQLLKRKLNHGS